ncbi:hypothetical protein B0H14DRAFT_3619924 [Mycena olivaceomarginata]|nr:hypothetical protein B0H14DRAFT_3619924 [Mycena olivaceomarginata]
MSGRRVILKIPKASGCGLPSLDPSESTLRKTHEEGSPRPINLLVPGLRLRLRHPDPPARARAAPQALPENTDENSDREYEQPNRELEEDDQEEENEQEEEPEEEEELELEQEPEEEELEELEEPEKEEEEEEEEEEERPAKRRKGAQGIQSALVFYCIVLWYQVKEPAPPVEITYNINFFSVSDMSKLGKKPQPKGSAILKLLDNITFARFERKVLAKFCALAKIVVPPEDEEVEVKFQVPRQVVNYVSLDDEDAYKHMVTAALRGQNPSVNLAISYSEDKVAPKSDVEEEKTTSKKNQARKASDFCWVSPEDGKHIALGHPHFNMWAAAWAHGNGDDETPPNHAIFSGNGNSGLASKSLLQRRAAAATSQASTATGPTIHNNFTIPDQLLNFFRPAGAPQPAPITQPYEPQLTLLPPGMNVSQQMPITTFCVIANLDDAIAEKFAVSGYRTTAAFRFIELKDLPLIQFLPGEIAELREAVWEWAVAT